jgi:D-serine dehydratase
LKLLWRDGIVIKDFFFAIFIAIGSVGMFILTLGVFMAAIVWILKAVR